MKIFVAGATGVIGRSLIPQLRAAGHEVAGTVRSEEKAELVRALGAVPVIVDVFDETRLDAAVAAVEPALIIHQLTALPDSRANVPPAEMSERNARIRREGTRNLIHAARQAGVRRLITQSIAWIYAPGPRPHEESDPLDLHGEGVRAITNGAVAELEKLTLSTPGLAGTILRYGFLFGPGTWYAQPTGDVTVHVDAAAQAALLAVDPSTSGVFNIVDDGGSASNQKARRELKWTPAFRSSLGPK